MRYLALPAVVFLLFSCSSKPKADLLVFNATIYTVDSSFSTAEAMAVGEGKILAVGKKDELREQYNFKDSIDAEGKFIYPGFIDAHAHFVGYGNSLQRVNLVDTKSWDEVVQRTSEFAAKNPDGWLLGRGWDQNDWPVKEFPTNEKLNELFPDRPVLLTRIDGHAAIANQKALDLAGVKAGDTVLGGQILTMPNPSKVLSAETNPPLLLTGVLIDNGIDFVSAKIPQQTFEQFSKALKDAEKNCFAMGLTTIDDCGLSYKSVDNIRKMQKDGSLRMRLYLMLSDDTSNFNYLERTGKIKTDRLNVRSIKVYGDGALGSRGACLLQPYSDKPGHYGFLLSTKEHFDSVANWIIQKDYQMCTHAIGDSGNRMILQVYGKYLKGKNDRRWRIEHAQVVNKDDFKLFGLYSIIPSVQPTHATSDMYWAGDRLGPERVKGAYAYKQLLDQNGWIPLGTDFPVEDISPFKTFLAGVVRKDAKGWPDNGYQMENALSREQTIRGMTIWAARSNFEENEKGSLEKGKFADFVILDRDLMKIPESEILQTLVLYTYLNGERVYKK
jgi:predicted amidohydrolase YtcJ